MATHGARFSPPNGRVTRSRPRPSGAEGAADRAEGKTAVSVEDAAERSRADEAVDVPEAAPDALSPDEKTAEVAEEHRERQASEGRGHGKY